MQDYIKASELSNKTKNENAGNLIVYTRDDIERMQAITLKDLLKSLRYFPYSENRITQSDLLNIDAFSNQSKGIRLYLNEHELQSPLYGSGYLYFGDIDLGFIDHVEIYTGFPSFKLGIEPATVVIRLYSKKALHDEGGKVKLMGGSNGSNLGSAYYSDKFDDFSYFTYISRYDNKRKSYGDNDNNLERNQLRQRFYGSLSTQNHRLEVHAVKSNSDAFLGRINKVDYTTNPPSVISSKNVNDNTFDYNSFSIATNSKFMDDTLTFTASYSTVKSTFNETSTQNYTNGSSITSNYKDVSTEDSFTILGEKKWHFDTHILSLGLQYRYKNFDVSNTVFSGQPTPFNQEFDTEQVYSLYVQDEYAINENNTLIMSIMEQIYKRNGDVDEPNNLRLRLGYIYTDDKISAKSTLSSQSFAAEPYTIISPHNSNINLKSERYNTATQEVTYTQGSTINNVILSFTNMSGYPVPNDSQIPVNDEDDINIFTATYEFTYLYSEKDKFEFHLNYKNSDTVDTLNVVQSSERFSCLLRSLNTFGKFDLFNEFWIVYPQADSEVYIDFSAGVKYRTTKDLSFNIKGENLFNKAEERHYLNPIPSNIYNTVNISVIDPKVWFGLEYLF